MEENTNSVRCPNCQTWFIPNEDTEIAVPDIGMEEMAKMATADTVALDIDALHLSNRKVNKRPDPVIRDSVRLDQKNPDTESGKVEKSSSAPVPEKIGGYRIIREIARGGMGIVYLAEQEKLKRPVALKVLRAGEGAGEEDISRFMREAEAAAALVHPNIVPIHELSEENGATYFTMDYIEGPSLEKLISEGHLTLRRSVEILEQIATTIDYAHTKGIVHRDLKPANVILSTDGIPMITDFGLAVNLSRDPKRERMTNVGVVMGTIPYIPPEQAAGKVESVVPGSDIYSMGAILYEMITGRPPFQGETQFELLHSVLNRFPTPPKKLNPKIPKDLQTICMKCLRKHIHHRYPTARALAEDCRAFLDGEVIKARPITRRYRMWRWITRHKAFSVMLVLVVLVVLGGSYAVNIIKGQADEQVKKAQQIEQKFQEQEVVIGETARQLEELTATLDPGWRLALFERFDVDGLNSEWETDGNVYFRRGYLSMMNMAERPLGPPKLNAALIRSYPGDCRVEFKVYIPRERGAILDVAVSSDSQELSGSFGYLVRIGNHSKPGAMIRKGPVTIAEAEGVSLEPDRWHLVEIERSGNNLNLSVDGEKVLEAQDETILRGDEHGRVGFMVEYGIAYIDDLRIMQPGSSMQMLSSILDMGDKFYQYNKFDLAIRMCEDVILESSDPVLSLRAWRRCISSYNRQFGYFKARGYLDELLDRLEQARGVKLLPGQRSYLSGVLALETRNYSRAIGFFDAASLESVRVPEDDRYVLLSRLEAVLTRIRADRVEESIRLLTNLQRTNTLSRLAQEHKEELNIGGTHSAFLSEVDRLLDSGRADTVWSLVEALRILFPESGRELAARCLRLSRIYEEASRWNEALDRLQAARSMAPDWEEPALAMAEAMLRRNNLDDCLKLLRKAGEDFPESKNVHMRLATFLLENAPDAPEKAEALKSALTAVQVSNRKDPAALDLLAQSYIALDENPKAAEVLREAIRLSPSRHREMILRRLEPELENAQQETQPAATVETLENAPENQ